MMSNKYGNMVGKIQLNIAGFDKEITPKVGDGRKFVKMLAKAENNKEKLFDEFQLFITEIIAREVPPENEEEQKELDLFVDMNLLQLLNEVMITFGMTTREDLERAKKESLQALRVGNSVKEN